jgi:hypothetical protein
MEHTNGIIPKLGGYVLTSDFDRASGSGMWVQISGEVERSNNASNLSQICGKFNKSNVWIFEATPALTTSFLYIYLPLHFLHNWKFTDFTCTQVAQAQLKVICL